MTDGSQEFQGPVALRLAKGAWALMQDRLQVLPFLGRQHRGHAHGHMGPMPQTVQVSLGKGIEYIVDGLACTPQVASYRGGRLSLGARPQNMASPYRKGIRGTTTVFQCRVLILGEWSYKFLWLHGQYYTAKKVLGPMTLLKMH